MISLQLKNEIIQQRSLGYSFDNIVSKTGVSKPTVMKVCKECQEAIDELKTQYISETIEDANKGVEARSSLFKDLIRRFYNEIATRDLSTVSTDKLMNMMDRAEHSLSEIEGRKQQSVDNKYSELSDDVLKKMVLAVTNTD